MSKEPIRHHYIPHFISRNFCCDNENHLHYYDKINDEYSVKTTQEIFMEKNLYLDSINSPNERMKIEKDLAKYEGEVAQIINKRFLIDHDIVITPEEDEKLKLFFALMGFRSKNASKKFGENASDESKEFYTMFQENGDLTDLWKRNLGYLVNCRSLRDVLNHPNIDAPFKVFMGRDTVGLTGMYFIVAERRGPLDFVISDAYPTLIQGEITDNFAITMYLIIPLSPNRVLFVAANGVERAPISVSYFKKDFFVKPRQNRETKEITIHVKKLYEKDIKYVNGEVLKNYCEGFACQDLSRIKKY